MCYTVPIAGAVVSTLAWHHTRKQSWWWLSLMFYGGALFGVVDHLWNRELFLLSPQLGKDLLLGTTIGAVIVGVWAFLCMGMRHEKRISLSLIRQK